HIASDAMFLRMTLSCQVNRYDRYIASQLLKREDKYLNIRIVST
ncbi:unnamed protein product, partial [Heterotrigona itama]